MRRSKPAIRQVPFADDQEPSTPPTTSTATAETPPTTDNPTADAPIQTIPIASIDRDGQNHRLKNAIDREKIQTLATSIRINGLEQPIAVCETGDHRHADGGRGRYRLVFGFRRLAAAELAGLDHIQARVYGQMSDAAVEIRRATENLDRQDLNPMEEVLVVTRMLKHWGGNVEMTATSLGRSETWVRDRGYLTRLAPGVAEMVSAGKLPLGHARELAKVGDPKRQLQLATWATEPHHRQDIGVMSLDKLRDLVSAESRALRVVPWQLDAQFAGKPACTGCPHNTATDQTLFGPGPAGDADGPGVCMNAGCFETKTNRARQQLEAAADKIAAKIDAKDQVRPQIRDGVAALGEKYSFLKPASVSRAVEKRVAPAPDGATTAKKKDQAADAEPKPTEYDRWHRKFNDWRTKHAAAIDKAAEKNPLTYVALWLALADEESRNRIAYDPPPPWTHPKPKSPPEPKAIASGPLMLISRIITGPVDLPLIEKLAENAVRNTPDLNCVHPLADLAPAAIEHLCKAAGTKYDRPPEWVDDFTAAAPKTRAQKPAKTRKAARHG